ncbi:hypothetical protein QTP88_007284 [Uroleucon formosanum]
MYLLFTTFLKSNSIVHLRTAPGHLATNGAAENAVKTTKHALWEALSDNKNKNIPKSVILNKFLLGYRNAPHSTTGESLSVLMLGRKLRCRLDLLYKTDEEVVLERQDKSIINYNGSQNKVFKEGDEVMIKSYKQGNKESWLKATMKRELGTKIYECESNENKTYIRHVDQNMIDATIVETETRKQDINNEVVNSTVKYDNNIKKRTRNVPSKTIRFYFKLKLLISFILMGRCDICIPISLSAIVNGLYHARPRRLLGLGIFIQCSLRSCVANYENIMTFIDVLKILNFAFLANSKYTFYVACYKNQLISMVYSPKSYGFFLKQLGLLDSMSTIG